MSYAKIFGIGKKTVCVVVSVCLHVCVLEREGYMKEGERERERERERETYLLCLIRAASPKSATTVRSRPPGCFSIRQF